MILAGVMKCDHSSSVLAEFNQLSNESSALTAPVRGLMSGILPQKSAVLLTRNQFPAFFKNL
jgi:hypothetical protein